MLDSSEIKDFIDYIIGDEDDKDYDENLPFGGIKTNAPDSAKRAYEEFVDRDNKRKKLGIK